MNNNFSTLKNLSLEREGKRERISSYDRSGGNSDFLNIKPGELVNIADIKGSGCINHIWVTMAEMPMPPEKNYLREILIRMYWDGEKNPSVEVPIGDFFGLGHSQTKNFNSMPLSMGPEDGKSFNSFFAMPFAEGARIERLNEYDKPIVFYYYIDYESYEMLADRYLRFHASWNRVNPCKGIDDKDGTNEFFSFSGKNATGKDNYIILEAEGKGHYVGCHLDIHNLRNTNKWDWYGEGDDMIFIDGEDWPPRLHGTGTEDYFNTAFSPSEGWNNPYYGLVLPGGKNWSGKISMYRYHIEDPIMFNKSIRVTIEHGHANHRSDDYSSTAYWYQVEPHKPFAPMMKAEDRLPMPETVPLNTEEVKKHLNF